MATLTRLFTMAGFAGLAFSGCVKQAGLDTPVKPLEQIHFQVTGDIASVQRADTKGQTPQLHVAMVWGAQAWPEPFCFLPPESKEAAAVIAAGCPDSFRFVPERAGADVEVQPNVPATIDIINLPSADVMVGDVTARVAYASLIVYDDRNSNGVLDFRHPQRRRREEDYDPGTPATRDIPYGASFISMTLPDQRVAYREGGFNDKVAFYPRAGCDPPPAGFSILSAGGFPQPDFSQPGVLAVALQPGQFPAETSCGEAKLDEAVVTIPLQAPDGEVGDAGAVDGGATVTVNLSEVACTVTDPDGTTFYTEAPATAPDLRNRACAWVGFPQLPGDAPVSGRQLAVAGAPDDPCQYVTHYTLRGCDNDPGCAAPRWDITATTPAWWTVACPTTP